MEKTQVCYNMRDNNRVIYEPVGNSKKPEQENTGLRAKGKLDQHFETFSQKY